MSCIRDPTRQSGLYGRLTCFLCAEASSRVAISIHYWVQNRAINAVRVYFRKKSKEYIPFMHSSSCGGSNQRRLQCFHTRNHLARKPPPLRNKPWVGQVHNVSGTLFTEKPLTTIDRPVSCSWGRGSCGRKISLTMRSLPFPCTSWTPSSESHPPMQPKPT